MAFYHSRYDFEPKNFSSGFYYSRPDKKQKTEKSCIRTVACEYEPNTVSFDFGCNTEQVYIPERCHFDDCTFLGSRVYLDNSRISGPVQGIYEFSQRVGFGGAVGGENGFGPFRDTRYADRGDLNNLQIRVNELVEIVDQGAIILGGVAGEQQYIINELINPLIERVRNQNDYNDRVAAEIQARVDEFVLVGRVNEERIRERIVEVRNDVENQLRVFNARIQPGMSDIQREVLRAMNDRKFLDKVDEFVSVRVTGEGYVSKSDLAIEMTALSKDYSNSLENIKDELNQLARSNEGSIDELKDKNAKDMAIVIETFESVLDELKKTHDRIDVTIEQFTKQDYEMYDLSLENVLKLQKEVALLRREQSFFSVEALADIGILSRNQDMTSTSMANLDQRVNVAQKDIANLFKAAEKAVNERLQMYEDNMKVFMESFEKEKTFEEQNTPPILASMLLTPHVAQKTRVIFSTPRNPRFPQPDFSTPIPSTPIRSNPIRSTPINRGSSSTAEPYYFLSPKSFNFMGEYFGAIVRDMAPIVSQNISSIVLNTAIEVATNDTDAQSELPLQVEEAVNLIESANADVTDTFVTFVSDKIKKKASELAFLIEFKYTEKYDRDSLSAFVFNNSFDTPTNTADTSLYIQNKELFGGILPDNHLYAYYLEYLYKNSLKETPIQWDLGTEETKRFLKTCLICNSFEKYSDKMYFDLDQPEFNYKSSNIEIGGYSLSMFDTIATAISKNRTLQNIKYIDILLPLAKPDASIDELFELSGNFSFEDIETQVALLNISTHSIAHKEEYLPLAVGIMEYIREIRDRLYEPVGNVQLSGPLSSPLSLPTIEKRENQSIKLMVQMIQQVLFQLPTSLKDKSFDFDVWVKNELRTVVRNNLGVTEFGGQVFASPEFKETSFSSSSSRIPTPESFRSKLYEIFFTYQDSAPLEKTAEDQGLRRSSIINVRSGQKIRRGGGERYDLRDVKKVNYREE